MSRPCGCRMLAPVSLALELQLPCLPSLTMTPYRDTAALAAVIFPCHKRSFNFCCWYFAHMPALPALTPATGCGTSMLVPSMGFRARHYPFSRSSIAQGPLIYGLVTLLILSCVNP
ncbi:hypothetical protein QBC33DRAFT_265382 [Phialemonium atrogriseum]|uniref:Uncharacterized protein n=1 Tax=Phialemonium atrogriseum TaxID=1093897 RepID=A0AAJ0C7G1_9PEZI|nr:uncharacterized protein QBC33DRAFT_265382 [Phialemonium atrogriseum]KAK1770388.1 hypothetical protein QBC33DRAFT_265382 [Phialemonium atrogriseum]